MATLVYYAVLLVTLQLAFGAFGPNPISDLLAGIVAFLPQLVIAIIIVVVAGAIAAAVKELISGAMGGLSYGKVLANIASIFILGLGIIAALSQIGVAVAVTLPVLITVLATVAGILIVGVGGGLVGPMRQRWETCPRPRRAGGPPGRGRGAEQRRTGQARPDGEGPRRRPQRPDHSAADDFRRPRRIPLLRWVCPRRSRPRPRTGCTSRSSRGSPVTGGKS